MAPLRCMCRSPPFGILTRKAVNWSGLCFAMLNARMALCSSAVTEDLVDVTKLGLAAGCATTERLKQTAAERLSKARSMKFSLFGLISARIARPNCRVGENARRLLYLSCV